MLFVSLLALWYGIFVKVTRDVVVNIYSHNTLTHIQSADALLSELANVVSDTDLHLTHLALKLAQSLALPKHYALSAGGLEVLHFYNGNSQLINKIMVISM